MAITERSFARLAERVPVRLAWPFAAALSLAGVALAALLRWELDPDLPPGFPFVTFFPVIIVTAFLFGRRIGALTAIASALVAWYFFIPPIGFVLSSGAAVALGFFLFITVIDIALIDWMQRAARQLVVERETSARLAETRELLFRELQHRVSNNLQMVGGLLTLQKRQIDDPAARLALDEAARRLGVIGRISRQLYDPRGTGRDMAAFLDALVGDVIEANGRRGIGHRIESTGAVDVAPEAAIPLALAVAEAVANAIEHGFAGLGQGAVTVRLDCSAGRVRVEVEDNGHGLAPDFQAKEGASLGLRLIGLLTGQLGGSFALERGARGGAIARIDLPLELQPGAGRVA